MKLNAEIAVKGRITYIVGPDGELCTVDANGHWCNEPETEAFQNGSPVAPVEEVAEENLRLLGAGSR